VCKSLPGETLRLRRSLLPQAFHCGNKQNENRRLNLGKLVARERSPHVQTLGAYRIPQETGLLPHLIW